MFIKKSLYSIYGSLIHNDLNSEYNSNVLQLLKQIAVHSYNGILLTNKKLMNYNK